MSVRGGSWGMAVMLAVVSSLTMWSLPASARAATAAVETRSAPVSAVRTFRLSRGATHVALHWRGARGADVDVAFSRDGRRFGRARHVELDEAGRRVGDGDTYGEVMLARGVRAVRVKTDRPLQRLSVLAISDRGRSSTLASAAGRVAAPAVISRRGWGADEALRFDARGREIWAPAFFPVQKLIVHHTAGENRDPDPPATIRAMYYYHAVTQGWGDIGYNFLVDAEGRVYEGRYSGAAGDMGELVDGTPGEDDGRRGVTAAHAYGYNSGTVGVALLGTLTEEDTQSAARVTLEEFLAWQAERHELDPRGEGVYVNPVTLASRTLPNILAHRDVASTDCPGALFYTTLPQLRDAVAQRLSAAPTSAPTPAQPQPVPPRSESPDPVPEPFAEPRPLPDGPPPSVPGLASAPTAGPKGSRTPETSIRPALRIGSRFLRADRRRRISVRVTCVSSGRLGCSGSLTLLAAPRVRGLSRTLARRSFRLSHSSTRLLTLRLSRSDARAARRRGRVRVVMRTVVYDGEGVARRTRRVLRLIAP
jgi:hypothetical protein